MIQRFTEWSIPIKWRVIYALFFIKNEGYHPNFINKWDKRYRYGQPNVMFQSQFDKFLTAFALKINHPTYFSRSYFLLFSIWNEKDPQIKLVTIRLRYGGQQQCGNSTALVPSGQKFSACLQLFCRFVCFKYYPFHLCHSWKYVDIYCATTRILLSSAFAPIDTQFGDHRFVRRSHLSATGSAAFDLYFHWPFSYLPIHRGSGVHHKCSSERSVSLYSNLHQCGQITRLVAQNAIPTNCDCPTGPKICDIFLGGKYRKWLCAILEE